MPEPRMTCANCGAPLRDDDDDLCESCDREEQEIEERERLEREEAHRGD